MFKNVHGKMREEMLLHKEFKLQWRAKASYKSADLWFDANGMPIQAKITAPNDDSTTVLLINLQKNVTVNKADFKLQVPPGIKPIRG